MMMMMRIKMMMVMMIDEMISLVMSWVEGFADSPSIPDLHYIHQSRLMTEIIMMMMMPEMRIMIEDDDGYVDDDHPWLTFTNHV